MPLVSSKEWMLKAQKEKFGIGAFNANNMEFVEAIIEVAEEEKSPVIIQVSQGAIKYAGLEMATEMVKAAAALASVPVVLHLDHGTDYLQNVRCLRAGFTSLMFDGSALSFEDNVKMTAKITEMSHACNIPVEAELGKVLQIGDNNSAETIEKAMTQSEEAVKFVAATKIDSLAVAIGSVHAMKDRTAKLDIPRLKKIRSVIDIPLVLHGSSGVDPESIKEGIANGLCKINVATQLSVSFVKAIGEAYNKNPNEKDMRKILLPGKNAVKDRVREYMGYFGCKGKGIITGAKSGIQSSEIKHHE
ncbi:MAG: tagatose-bisphosphate aldolase [Candidatus Firestonebacteria bacterium RIFOXYC2_FULL_39_67]|nr:MAG: tagatose-bisphosphate aldolase [Candidatus Firestonebacteria bacterium RIFOXYD2_FULL_39_29]OGF51860.1 MAG: tagatose-bisphosphate aldolase [Candidatus Firestonebacteria bacterium RifOxyC12_full_39_7]OGF54639.1 MAG: tagatose-bisphosphate aldolase [Candidatus Firestonebacteria bacterium RIFOXYC2_FULL_39_67]